MDWLNNLLKGVPPLWPKPKEGEKILVSESRKMPQPGEICIVIVRGHEREARWSPDNGCFFFTDCTHPAQNAYCAVDSVEEWWPASVKF